MSVVMSVESPDDIKGCILCRAQLLRRFQELLGCLNLWTEQETQSMQLHGHVSRSRSETRFLLKTQSCLILNKGLENSE